MNLKEFADSPSIPPENIPAAYINTGLMVYAELRTIRAQLSHLIEHLSNQSDNDLDAYYGKEGEKFFDEAWVSLLAKLGKWLHVYCNPFVAKHELFGP